MFRELNIIIFKGLQALSQNSRHPSLVLTPGDPFGVDACTVIGVPSGGPRAGEQVPLLPTYHCLPQVTGNAPESKHTRMIKMFK